MDGLILFRQLTALTLSRLCRQLWLLAGLAVLCAALPLLAGQTAESALSDGTPFSGIVLAVTGPEEDALPGQLERVLNSMADLAQYCRVAAMERAAAWDALSAGQVTAVLELPENFVRDVQSGENPALRIIVDSGRPLESLLTLWIGQSAADLLAAAQAGIYSVLEEYDRNPPAGLSRDRAVMEINLKYIQWTLNRQGLFREERLLPTDILPVALHYALSLLAFLALSIAPVFAWMYQRSWMSGLKRLRYASRSPLWGLIAGWFSVWLMVTAALFPAMLALDLSVPPALGTAAGWAVFLAAWASACALLTESAAGCGGLSFLLALAMLALSGGIIPPVLLPDAVRKAMALSPITWMRAAAAQPLGYDAMKYPVEMLLLGAGSLCALSGWLYFRRAGQEEATG